MLKKFLILILSLQACTIDSSYKRPNIDLPASWDINNKELVKNNAVNTNRWWSKFNDTVLNSMISEALKANSDILTAMSNISLARSNLESANETQFPEITLNGSAERIKNSGKVKSISGTRPTNVFEMSNLLSFQLDLWGKLANTVKAEKELLLAAESTRDTVVLTVESNVASSYFNLISLHNQLKINETIVKNQEEIFRLNSKLTKLGVSDNIALSQSEASLNSARSNIPIIIQQIKEQETSLSVLLGRNPHDIVTKEVLISGLSLPNAPDIPIDLPSKLLENRPDIKAAESNLIAAGAEVAVAKAAYFPDISMTALLGLQSNNIDDLLKSQARTWNMISNVTVPIIDFGRTKTNVEIAKNTEEQCLIQYQQTIRVAFQEVANALSANKNTEKQLSDTVKNQKSLEEAMFLTNKRYNLGNVSYLSVLTAEQALLQAKITTLNAKLKELNASINLFQALGGDANGIILKNIL